MNQQIYIRRQVELLHGT